MRLPKVKIVVALLSFTLLAACGRSSDDGGGTAQSPGQNATAPAKAKLTMWAMGSDGDNLPKLLKKFETENPGYTVDVTSIPWQDAAAKFRTAEAGGVTPDIAQVGTALMGGITDGCRMARGETLRPDRGGGIDDHRFNSVQPQLGLLYVGWTEPGNWLRFSVQVTEPGPFTATLLYAAPQGAPSR